MCAFICACSIHADVNSYVGVFACCQAWERVFVYLSAYARVPCTDTVCDMLYVGAHAAGDVHVDVYADACAHSDVFEAVAVDVDVYIYIHTYIYTHT